MCLLIAGTASQIRTTLLNTKGLIADIFDSNADGVGAMFTDDGALMTPKLLPKNLGEAVGFIQCLPDDDRQLALHWRMRTHGDTDLDNCHPYTVVEGRIAMMHNGVLSQGNKADPSKSDTWHYIKDVVRPMLTEAQFMFLNPAWVDLVESDIGSGNRFAIMDDLGNLSILNKHTGLDVNGMWFSNTYAWSPELLIEGYKKKGSYRSGGYGWGSYMDDDWYGPIHRRPLATVPTALLVQLAEDEDDEAGTSPFSFGADDVFDALDTGSAHQMGSFLAERPLFVLAELMNDATFLRDDRYEYDEGEAAILDLLESGDRLALARMVLADKSPSGKQAAEDIAAAICWHGDWTERPRATTASGAIVLGAAEEEISAAVREFELAQEAGRKQLSEQADYAAG